MGPPARRYEPPRPGKQNEGAEAPSFCFVGTIGRYANPRFPERTLEELQRLIEKLSHTRPSEAEPEAVIRDVNRRLGSKTIARLVADYRAGTPTTQLTVKYGIGKSTVLRLLEDAGVPMRRQPISDEVTIMAVSLYEAGKSLAAIAREVGQAKQSIRLALLKAGVEMRPSGGQRRSGHGRSVQSAREIDA